MDWSEVITLSYRTFLTMLVIMDPVGLAPMFIALARDRPAFEKKRLALKATLVAGGIIFVFGLFGGHCSNTSASA